MEIKKNQIVEFTHAPNHPNWEWIDGKFNIAFAGKMKDEKGLRDYILGNFEELDTMQLITLLRGERYPIVVGADV